MNIKPIAIFRSPLKTKFGVPRQAGIATALKGQVVFLKEFCHEDAVRGLEGFDYIWLIWGFSEAEAGNSLTVRPPRLGGNERMGVFATRSPFRPNGLGLSSVLVEKISFEGSSLVIDVIGADLMDGTPIYDIKPYVEYTDSHVGVRNGFTDTTQWTNLKVIIDDAVSEIPFTKEEFEAVTQLLAADPRPHYHHDPHRIYGMTYGDFDVRFRVTDGKAIITEISSQR